MQDLYSIEYARRGYTVIAVDMHGHGDTEITAADEVYSSAVGIDAAVALAASLPYVDKGKIGITGHSSGGAACDMEIAIDNERENPIVSAVLFQASTWCDDTGVDLSAQIINKKKRSGNVSRHSNRPHQRCFITIAIIKQRRFHTYNSLFQERCYHLLL